VPSSNSTVICNTCNKEVDVTDVQNGINYDEYYLSCGHIQNINKQITKDIINDKQSTCNICGLTARSNQELEEHKFHAHHINKEKNNKRSFEQNVDPFP
jgi:hypothetical protein